jgi:hypothetical protein
MKKTFLILSACISLNAVQAQDEKAFHKGVITADADIGFAIYGTKVHSEYDQKNWLTGATERIAQDTTDGAGSSIYSLSGEYGVTNWLGVGARFAFSNYIEETQNDTTFTGTYTYKPKARGVDFGVNVSFHLVKGKRFDMPLCLIMGYSNFKYMQNNPNENPAWADSNAGGVAKDNGMNYGILLCPKIYFGSEQHIGIAFHIGYLGYNYRSMTFSNDSDANLNDENNWTYHLKGNGFNIGIGLSAKF